MLRLQQKQFPLTLHSIRSIPSAILPPHIFFSTLPVSAITNRVNLCNRIPEVDPNDQFRQSCLPASLFRKSNLCRLYTRKRSTDPSTVSFSLISLNPTLGNLRKCLKLQRRCFQSTSFPYFLFQSSTFVLPATSASSLEYLERGAFSAVLNASKEPDSRRRIKDEHLPPPSPFTL